MSTIDYGIYKIGKVERMGAGVNDKGEANDISLFNLLVPTYGAWAGPEWSANHRAPRGTNINWNWEPCMNDSIMLIETNPAIDPYSCYSIIDAAAKHHDWDYEVAEHSGSSELSLKYQADIELLNIVAAAKAAFSSGAATYSYDCMSGKGEGYNPSELQTKSYICHSFDSTERGYAWLLSLGFAFKTFFSSSSTNEERADIVTPLNQICSDMTEVTDNVMTTKRTAEGNYTVVNKDADGDDNAGYAIDTKEYLAIDMGRVKGSAGSEVAFDYKGDGKICINCGSDNNKIYTSENGNNATYYEINGGDGYDEYYLADSNSFLIKDSGKNKIYKEDESGGWMSAGNLYRTSSDDIWFSADSSEKITHSSPWTLTFSDGSTVQFADTFQSGDFGINLITRPDNPVTTNTITGTENDDLFLNGTAANDLIEGGAGNDQFNVTMIGGAYGGNDWFKGGSGNDLIQAWFSENSVVEGNAGSDYITGSMGKNVLFGDDYGEMDQLIAAGETAQSIDERGDLIRGDVSEDYIYGSNRNDILFGDIGKDLMVGGAGNDVIYADDYFNTASGGWSATVSNGVVILTNIDYVQRTTGDDDVIYGGTGNDFILAGYGDDEVYGGTDHDTVYGGAGHDFIEGGTGNDVLFGDDFTQIVPADLHGNDYIDGGDGNDSLQGNGGNDAIYCNIIQFRNKLECKITRQWDAKREILRRAA